LSGDEEAGTYDTDYDTGELHLTIACLCVYGGSG
jgi:hypothetical protein